MRTRTGMSVVLALTLAATAAAEDAPPLQESPDPTIAVIAFEGDAIPSGWYWSCCRRVWSPGFGVADMVAVELERQLRGRRPGVVDSAALQRLLIAENLHEGDDLSVETAARIAGELGADLAVLGRTSVFEVFDVSIPFDRHDHRAWARVTLEAKIIDVRSGVVVAQARGLGRIARSVPPWDQGDYASADIGSTGFRRTLLGQTTDRAVRALCDRIRARVRALTRREFSPAGSAAAGRHHP